jgi:hypothetical protein
VTADARRKARAGASKRYGPRDVALFEPHVLLELDGLRVGLDALRDDLLRDDLELVLSSILVKLSRKASDTSEQSAARRIAAGYPARLFVRKTEELAARLAAIAEPLARAGRVRVIEGDARALPGVADGSIAAALTSPPYPGVYDYLAQHETRLRWLRMESRRFGDIELGARRKLDPLGASGGRTRWREELGQTLRALARVLAGNAPLVLLMADSVIARMAIYAVDEVRALAPEAQLSFVSVASQERQHFHSPSMQAFANRPRREHAILLVRHPRRPR